MLRVFVPKEISDGENRVAAIPETVKKMIKAGLEVTVESGAGESAGVLDSAFQEAGAQVSSNREALYREANLVLKVASPSIEEIQALSEKSAVVSFLLPHMELEKVRLLRDRKITMLSMNLIPRTTLAQKMDALSSQSNIAGYKSVILAAEALGKIFPLLMTAAGTLNPAKVVVLGAGVAGLQAIATAKRLGAVVEASDVRLAAKEQVESLGAKFIEVPFEENTQDENGYAREASPEFLKRQAEEVAKRVANADIVIATALVPGRKAPILITEAMVQSMRSGSVIVDMAVEQGGNCALSELGKTVTKYGVKIIGTPNLPSTVAVHSSEMYAKNVFNLVTHLLKDSQLHFDMENEITSKTLVTHEEKIVHQATQELLQKESS